MEDGFKSKSDMYQSYKSWCSYNGATTIQRKKFCKILEGYKILTTQNLCDTCVAYKEGNLSEEEYQIHLSKKNEARDANKLAIASCSDQHLVVTMDFRAHNFVQNFYSHLNIISKIFINTTLLFIIIIRKMFYCTFGMKAMEVFQQMSLFLALLTS